MLKPGDTLDRYTIDTVLGQGGMGTVYRAHDTRLDRRVAIKVITEGTGADSADARLLREARAAAALDHPNVLSIHDVGELDGAPYIVMELVSGRTLREAVVDASTPVNVRVGWLVDVARALAAAHKKGLVHRDIKPENVMVRDDGVVKVLDFGIARRAQGGATDAGATTQATALPTLTKEGVKVGTPLYMAPEQIRGEGLDGRADQFAWGVVAYELFTGRLPWRGVTDPLSAVASILTDEPDARALDAAGVPADVKATALRALSKKPEERFGTMDEIVRALDPAARDQASSSAAAKISVRPTAEPAVSALGPTAASATLLKRYSTEEVRAILERAVDRQTSGDTRLGFEDLLAAAREVGVDEQTLREASRELRARADASEEESAERVDFEAWRRRKIRGFWRHVWVWVAVNIPFLVIAMGKHHWGPLMPALWWGIAIGIHAMKAFTAHEDDWREQRERQERKQQRRRRREAAVERAIDEGASILLQTGASLRQRIQAPAADRVRIAADTGRTAAAEEEAAAVAEDARARRRR